MKSLLISMAIAASTLCAAQERPFIQANAEDKTRVLALVGRYKWAADCLDAHKRNVAKVVAEHKTDPVKALEKCPSLTQGGRGIGNWMRDAKSAAMVHFLTGDVDCAQLAADRLNALVQIHGVEGKPPTMGGGWEMRAIYHEIALCYDYIHPFLILPGTTVYDAASGKRIPFDDQKAQILFSNIVDHCFQVSPGTSNLAAMYIDSHLYAALCLNDKAERDSAVERIVNGWGKRNRSGVIALRNALIQNRGVLPESASYSGMGSSVVVIMEVVDRLYPEYKIFEGFEEALLGATQRWFLNYPNGKEITAFGDSRRRSNIRSSDTFNRAIRRAGFEKVAQIVFGKIKADRAANGYQPDNLWTMDPLEDYEPRPLTTQSIHLLHAGFAMQNNLHTGDPSRHGLMYYTAGGSYVHSQLSGLDLELYGPGQVMSGVGGSGDPYEKGDRGSFRFINFYRNYAGHNTVVINGESKGSNKGWKGQEFNGMDTVELQAMEPMPFTPAVSKEFTFSCQALVDTVNNAVQQRTVSIVRTSENTGYYLDLFRSRSRGENRFHDYIYRNIGDAFTLCEGGEMPLPLTPDVKIERTYGEHTYTDWERFRSTEFDFGRKGFPRLFPGWNFFENVAFSQKTSHSVMGRFDITSGQKRHMHVVVPGGLEREYTTATAPTVFETLPPYDRRPAQIFSIRQHGVAWDQPFIVVFEPSTSEHRSVQSVDHLMDGKKVVGAKVISKVDGKLITDRILALDSADGSYEDRGARISFTGRFAIARLIETEGRSATVLYIGDGDTLSVQRDVLSVGKGGKGYRAIW